MSHLLSFEGRWLDEKFQTILLTPQKISLISDGNYGVVQNQNLER